MDFKTLTEQLSARLDVPREDIGILMHAFANVVESCAADRDVVTIPGFGVIETRQRAERIAVHPSTGKRMLYPPKITLTFRPSSLLRKLLNEESENIASDTDEQ